MLKNWGINMKVLKEPEWKPRKRYYYGKCSTCKGEYSFRDDEVRVHELDIKVICPNCKNWIYLWSSKKATGITKKCIKCLDK